MKKDLVYRICGGKIMIHELKINDEEYLRILAKKQVMIVVPVDRFETEVKFFDELVVNNQNEKLKVTGVSVYSSIKDIFNIVPYTLFNDKGTLENTIDYYENLFNNYNNFYVLRVKTTKETNELDITDSKLLDLIDINSIQNNSMGNSVTRVYKVVLKNGEKAILKTQSIASRVTLEDEYKRLLWLQGKVECPKILYFSKNDDHILLLMECIEGKVAYEYKNIGFKLGKFLKKIHSLDVDECPFRDNSVDMLMEKAEKKLHFVVNSLLKMYPNDTEESLLNFIREHCPKNDAVIHGDFCLPNVIVTDSGEMKIIDVGDLSVSTKYFDFYHFIKSLRINKMENELDEFKKGYGISSIDENQLKWMNIMDEILF